MRHHVIDEEYEAKIRGYVYSYYYTLAKHPLDCINPEAMSLVL